MTGIRTESARRIEGGSYTNWVLNEYADKEPNLPICNEYSCSEKGIYGRVISINNHTWEQYACKEHAVNE